MKFIIAVIQPQKTDEVREALSAVGVVGVTASNVRGYGRQKGRKEIYRGAEYDTDFLPKVKLEIAAPDQQADTIVQAIREAANTGAIGDGKVFVLDLQQAIRIRTGETDQAAL